MTDKLKCPFCQQELKEIYCNGICVGLACKNVDCLETKSTLGNKALWQALMQSQKDLEKSEKRSSIREKKLLDWQMQTFVLHAKLKIAKSALRQIESRLVISPEFVAREALKQIEQEE